VDNPLFGTNTGRKRESSHPCYSPKTPIPPSDRNLEEKPREDASEDLPFHSASRTKTHHPQNVIVLDGDDVLQRRMSFTPMRVKIEGENRKKNPALSFLNRPDYSNDSADASPTHGRLRTVTPSESKDNDDFQDDVFMKHNVKASKRARTPEETEPTKDSKTRKAHIKEKEKAAPEERRTRSRSHAYDACSTSNARTGSLTKTSVEAAPEKRGRGHPPGKKKKALQRSDHVIEMNLVIGIYYLWALEL
jgi:hypothetical protein